MKAFFNSKETNGKNDELVKECLNSAYFKIFLNYTQLVSISQSLDLKWEKSLVSFFQFTDTMSGAFLKVINIECLFGGFF